MEVKCPEETRRYWREYKRANKDKVSAQQRTRMLVPANRLKHLCAVNGRNGETRKTLDYNGLLTRMESNDWRCELTGAKFDFSSARNPLTLSIDRIDPTLGYTNDNVRLVCWWVNCAMGTWGLDKLQQLIQEWHHRD